LIIDNDEDLALYSYPEIEFVSRLGNAFNWHESRIKAIAVTSDGKTVASIDGSDIVKIWDVEKRDIVNSFQTLRLGDANEMKFDSKNQYLIIGSNPEKGIEIWNYKTSPLLIHHYPYPEGNSNDFDLTDNDYILNAKGRQLIYFKGIYEPIGVEEPDIIIVDDIIYPNPTNNLVNIEFSLLNPDNVIIELLNLNGQLIEIITNDFFPTGLNKIQYDCSNLASGAYFVHIVKDGNFTISYKLIKR